MKTRIKIDKKLGKNHLIIALEELMGQCNQKLSQEQKEKICATLSCTCICGRHDNQIRFEDSKPDQHKNAYVTLSHNAPAGSNLTFTSSGVTGNAVSGGFMYNDMISISASTISNQGAIELGTYQ